MRPQNPSSRGFTLIEILLALALMALIATAITYTVGAMHRQSDSNVLQAEMKRLNDAVTAFTASGGTITGSDTALTVLAKIQTPVNTTTFHALGTMTGYLPATYDLQAYSAADGYARLVWNGSHYQIATSGTGYRPVTLATPKNLTPQNIPTVGQTFATTSQWVWQYQSAGTGGANNPANLSISGPSSITTPGSYTWTLTSSQSGPLSLTLNNGQIYTAVGSSMSQGEAFNYGDRLTFTIIGTFTPGDLTSASTTSLLVTVSIPTSVLAVNYSREDLTTSTNFTYTQVSNPNGPPSVRDGIVLSVAGNPPGVSVYYTYDGSAPTAGSNLYTGPFQVPLPAWSSSISLKAVAISTSGSMVSGPILSLTLTPLQTQLAAPSFNPVSGSTISQSTAVQVIPANSTTDSPRTALGGAAPTNTSSLSLSFTFPSP